MYLLVDLFLVAIVLYHLARGWRTGFLNGVIGLAVGVGSLLAALRFYEPLSPRVTDLVGLEEALAQPVAFLLLLIGAGALLSALGGALLTRFPPSVHRSRANQLFGLVTGGAVGLLWAAIVASLILSLPISGSLLAAARESTLADPLARQANRVEARLQPIFGQAVQRTLNLLTVQPESGESIALPYTVTDALPRPDLEAEMLVLVNRERAAVGLPPLTMDEELIPVARAHSADMFARGYFSHETPEGLTPFDRMQAAGVSYLTAGENLAHAPTLAIAHDGLMRSPGHRENILRPQFGRVGIGILDGDSRGLMITQKFREPEP